MEIPGVKHFILTQTVLNTAKWLKVVLPGTEGALKVILEDLIIDVSAPSIVASTRTTAYGTLYLGDQEAAAPGPGLESNGAVATVWEEYVSDATPLPVVHAGATPIMREGPFDIGRSPDGSYYITIYVTSAACTAMMSLTGRVDYTIYR
jgi:hypothetical protein